MINNSLSFNFSHLKSRYILTSRNKVEAENNRENIEKFIYQKTMEILFHSQEIDCCKM
jgi:hypothetical protein